jgi:hypothetical protein
LRIEWLVGVVVRPGVPPTPRVVRIVTTGEQHDGQARIARPHFLGKRIAVALEGGVDDGSNWPVAHMCERALRTVGGDHAEVVASERDRENLAHRGAVVDGEEGLGHVSFSIPQR